MFDWTRRTGSTGSIGTGPTSDHTYATLAGTFIVSLSMKFSKLLEVSGYTIYVWGWGDYTIFIIPPSQRHKL